MQYGLGASLLKMRKAFAELMGIRRIAREPVYQRLALLESDGNLLVDTADSGAAGLSAALDNSAAASGFRILVTGTPPLQKVVVSSALYHKGRFMGHLLAWINQELVLRELIARETESADANLLVYSGSLPPQLVLGAVGDHDDFDAAPVQHLPDGGIVAQVAVPDTPFKLLGVFPRAGQSGFLSSPWFTLSLLLLAVALLAGVGLAIRVRTDNLVLRAHIDEADRQEALLQQKNQRLEEEIRTRRAYEQELVQARQAAEAASRAKSEFLATMSHEIRTPLNGVLGMTQLLEDTRLSPDQKEYLTVINDSGRALLTVINDILDFSKIEAGRLRLEAIVFDLERSIYDVAHLFTARCAEKNIELILDYESDCPRQLRGDAGRIRQILLNLVGNAVKFTEAGHVLVRVTQQAEAPSAEQVLLNLSVTDTGIGISQDEQERLFQSFTQADSSTSRRFGGTGLGLAICKQLVELMGGRIGVHSTPAVGSEFWIELPLPLANAPRPLPERQLMGLPVLLIDNNAINREVIGRMLEQFGLLVSLAGNAEQAMAQLYQAAAIGSPYRITVLDYHLAGINGEKLARQIHATPEFANMPLVLLISAAQRSDAVRFRSAGFSAYLTKPVISRDLQHALGAALGQQTAPPPNLNTHHRVAKSGRQDQSSTQLIGHILVAEDVKPNQIVAGSMLKRFGLSVEFADDGNLAVEKWRDGQFNLILMDCQMPNLDGYQATRAIRAEEQRSGRRRTPVLALTANAFADNQQRCLAAGMDDFLSKPFELERLRNALGKWLPRSDESPPTSACTLNHTALTSSPLIGKARKRSSHNCRSCAAVAIPRSWNAWRTA
jgi:signal transduction histidine kinase/DNA-binding response OmpR family regulator